MRSYAHTLALLASLGPLPVELTGRPEKREEPTSPEQRERALAWAEAKRARRRARNRAVRA